MPFSFRPTVHLISAFILSLLAQTILLIPERGSLFLRSFPFWGSVAFGAALFMLSIYFYIVLIRSTSIDNRNAIRSNGLLLSIQVLSVIGFFFILRGNDSRVGETGLLLTGL